RVSEAAGDLGVVAALVAPVVGEPLLRRLQAGGAAEDDSLAELLGREVAPAGGAEAIVELERAIDERAIRGREGQHARVPHRIVRARSLREHPRRHDAALRSQLP